MSSATSIPYAVTRKSAGRRETDDNDVVPVVAPSLVRSSANEHERGDEEAFGVFSMDEEVDDGEPASPAKDEDEVEGEEVEHGSKYSPPHTSPRSASSWSIVGRANSW